jgi:hypothetical protein
MKARKWCGGGTAYSLYRTLDKDDDEFYKTLDKREKKVWSDDIVELILDEQTQYLNEYIKINDN